MALTAAPLLINAIKTAIGDEPLCVISPDLGGGKRADLLREALQVAMHDAGFKVPLPPQRRYNAAQRITYSAIVLMGGFSLLTGLSIYKPAQLHWLTALLGGYQWARWEHFWLTMGYVGFFAIHIAQVIRAGWANFRSMVCGCDLVDAPVNPDTNVDAKAKVTAHE